MIKFFRRSTRTPHPQLKSNPRARNLCLKTSRKISALQTYAGLPDDRPQNGAVIFRGRPPPAAAARTRCSATRAGEAGNPPGTVTGTARMREWSWRRSQAVRPAKFLQETYKSPRRAYRLLTVTVFHLWIFLLVFLSRQTRVFGSDTSILYQLTGNDHARKHSAATDHWQVEHRPGRIGAFCCARGRASLEKRFR